MKRIVCLVCVLAIGTLGWTQSAELILKRFQESWNKHDAKTLATLIKGAKLGPDIQNEETWKRLPTIDVSNVDFLPVAKGGRANFDLVISMHGKETLRMPDGATFVRDGDSLLIVPADPDEPLQAGVSTMALMVADPNFFRRQKEDANTLACVSNLRQIGLALIIMAGDNDDILKIGTTQESAHRAIAPYIRRGVDLWTGPGLDGKTLSVNMNLAGKSIDPPGSPPFDPAHPPKSVVYFDHSHADRIVLAYEGKNGRLEYWHSGKGAVVFLNGHCKLITPEDAKTLVWKPAAAPTKKASRQAHRAKKKRSGPRHHASGATARQALFLLTLTEE